MKKLSLFLNFFTRKVILKKHFYMKSPLKISKQEVEGSDDALAVAFEGEFDKIGHMDIRDELEKIISELKKKDLLFDFTRLKFINSESIGYLMEIHNKLDAKGKRLVLLAPDKHVKDVLKTIGILDVIPVFASVSSYLKA